jgi:hypothetical protein
VRCFSREKLGAEVADFVLVCIAALTGATKLELGVCREESLMVGWSTERFLASCLGNR